MLPLNNMAETLLFQSKHK